MAVGSFARIVGSGANSSILAPVNDVWLDWDYWGAGGNVKVDAGGILDSSSGEFVVRESGYYLGVWHTHCETAVSSLLGMKQKMWMERNEDFSLDVLNSEVVGAVVLGGKIWVCNNNADKVFAYELNGVRDSGSDVTLHQGNGYPIGIGGYEDKLWVLDGTDMEFYVYGVDGVFDENLGFGLDDGNADPGGIVITDSGRLWVADGGGKMFEYDLVSGDVVSGSELSFSLDIGNRDPGGITFHDGKLWVTDSTDNKVYAYNAADGVGITTSDFGLDTLNRYPGGITFYDGKFWVLEQPSSQIFAYNAADGSRIPASDIGLATGNSNAQGITVLNDKFYVLNYTNDRIYVYNVDGTHDSDSDFDLNVAGIDAFGIAAYDNKLWLIGASGVYVYNADGSRNRNLDFDVALGLSNYHGITFYDGKFWILAVDYTDSTAGVTKVFFVGTDGSQDTSSFDLDVDNVEPKGVVVVGDGKLLVIDGNGDKVFGYEQSGARNVDLDFDLDVVNVDPKGFAVFEDRMWVPDGNGTTYVYNNGTRLVRPIVGTEGAGFAKNVNNDELYMQSKFVFKGVVGDVLKLGYMAQNNPNGSRLNWVASRCSLSLVRLPDGGDVGYGRYGHDSEGAFNPLGVVGSLEFDRVIEESDTGVIEMGGDGVVMKVAGVYLVCYSIPVVSSGVRTLRVCNAVVNGVEAVAGSYAYSYFRKRDVGKGALVCMFLVSVAANDVLSFVGGIGRAENAGSCVRTGGNSGLEIMQLPSMAEKIICEDSVGGQAQNGGIGDYDVNVARDVVVRDEGAFGTVGVTDVRCEKEMDVLCWANVVGAAPVVGTLGTTRMAIEHHMKLDDVVVGYGQHGTYQRNNVGSQGCFENCSSPYAVESVGGGQVFQCEFSDDGDNGASNTNTVGGKVGIFGINLRSLSGSFSSVVVNVGADVLGFGERVLVGRGVSDEESVRYTSSSFNGRELVVSGELVFEDESLFDRGVVNSGELVLESGGLFGKGTVGGSELNTSSSETVGKDIAIVVGGSSVWSDGVVFGRGSVLGGVFGVGEYLKLKLRARVRDVFSGRSELVFEKESVVSGSGSFGSELLFGREFRGSEVFGFDSGVVFGKGVFGIGGIRVSDEAVFGKDLVVLDSERFEGGLVKEINSVMSESVLTSSSIKVIKDVSVVVGDGIRWIGSGVIGRGVMVVLGVGAVLGGVFGAIVVRGVNPVLSEGVVFSGYLKLKLRIRLFEGVVFRGSVGVLSGVNVVLDGVFGAVGRVLGVKGIVVRGSERFVGGVNTGRGVSFGERSLFVGRSVVGRGVMIVLGGVLSLGSVVLSGRDLLVKGVGVFVGRIMGDQMVLVKGVVRGSDRGVVGKEVVGGGSVVWDGVVSVGRDVVVLVRGVFGVRDLVVSSKEFVFEGVCVFVGVLSLRVRGVVREVFRGIGRGVVGKEVKEVGVFVGSGSDKVFRDLVVGGRSRFVGSLGIGKDTIVRGVGRFVGRVISVIESVDRLRLIGVTNVLLNRDTSKVRFLRRSVRAKLVNVVVRIRRRM